MSEIEAPLASQACLKLSVTFQFTKYSRKLSTHRYSAMPLDRHALLGVAGGMATLYFMSRTVRLKARPPFLQLRRRSNKAVLAAVSAAERGENANLWSGPPTNSSGSDGDRLSNETVHSLHALHELAHQQLAVNI